MMKRRQVVTGLLAFTALGTIPRSLWHASKAEEVSEHTDVMPSMEYDLDPPVMVDPVSDSERTRVVMPSAKPATAELTSRRDKIEQFAEHNSASQSTVSQQIAKTPVSDNHNHHASTQAPLDEQQVATHLPAQPVATPNGAIPEQLAQASVSSESHKSNESNGKQIRKNIDFERDYADDLFVNEQEKVLLQSVALRLKKLQNTIGYGNFNIVSFDEALVYGKRFSAIGQFTPQELVFIEKMFATQAAEYGFYGDKVIDQLTFKITKKDVFKVPHTGHYLYRGDSLDYYEKIRKSVGGNIILTSGIRSNVKQLHLFLAKIIRVNGNVSRASRSLAPPGYSYHGIGDFDVGRAGWGVKNFSDDFAQTDEFKRMQDLGYIAIRYDRENQLGVRFEPWHIQVV